MKITPLSSFRKNRNLLFQFILSEFFVCCQIASTISKSSPEKGLLLLTGAHPDYMRIYSWTQEDGHLTRLRNYASLLHETSSEPPLTALEKSSSRAWEKALKVLDKIRMGVNIENEIEKIPPLIKSLQAAIVKCLPLFKRDENTLFFILRHANQFNSCFGDNAVKNQLKKLFPEGVNEAQVFLSEKFTCRKHLHLLPQIEAFLATL